jgi:hypothetical protein
MTYYPTEIRVNLQLGGCSWAMQGLKRWGC